MGQQKGNPTPSYQNQGYETLYPNKDRSHERSSMVAPVMLDADINIEQYVSNRLKANLPITSSGIIVNGSVRAEEYIVNVFSSSVLYSSGSTLFGDTLEDKHTFTGSLYISGSINNIEAIMFDTEHETPANVEGLLTWNDTDGTLNLGMKGGNVMLQVGQEELVRVVNKSGANLLQSQYHAVRVRTQSEGGAQGQRLAVVDAIATNQITSETTLGIVTEDINLNQEGFITTFGFVRNVNTTGNLQGETWLDGDVLYLSSNNLGGLTKVRPVAPYHTVTMGYVAYSHPTNGIIFAKVDAGSNLDELHDVYINNTTLTGNIATGGSSLYYSGSVWTNNQNIRIAQSTVVLASVSASLNFADDTAAAAGGVPLGGLYRNGNVIQIRLV